LLRWQLALDVQRPMEDLSMPSTLMLAPNEHSTLLQAIQDLREILEEGLRACDSARLCQIAELCQGLCSQAAGLPAAA
ncbi:MAG: hypothetical protein ACYCSR_11255, partial [Thiomonas sp.]